MTVKKLGRYELIRVLGKGAMGVVYEGRDPNLDRRVAIKTVKVENLSEDAASEYEHRFRTEARSAARLQHPNIVSVYDSDRDGNVAFLVMEYIQGDDLKHYLDRGVRYSLEQSTRMIRDLLSALEYAHQQGIVHRDIKPANLLIEMGGRLKLTDFGVARIQDSGDATRTQGAMVGTLKYMAPEQVQGLKTDARADLFSVGVVLYQLLTDKRPFDGDNDFSIIQQIISHEHIPPSTINPGLPTAIDAVVARALAKNRDDRFSSARDFAVALQTAIRRAEDQSVLPPADPNRIHDESAGGSAGAASAPGLHPEGQTTATIGSVTQELELVYWKDVKDSTDAEEIQGFLSRFPAGIYADLANRRLRRMATAATGDQTRLSGAPLDTAAQLQAAGIGEGFANAQEDETLPLPRRAPAAESRGSTQGPAARPKRASVSARQARNAPWLLLAGVGVLAVASALVAFTMAKGGKESGLASSPLAAAGMDPTPGDIAAPDGGSKPHAVTAESSVPVVGVPAGIGSTAQPATKANAITAHATATQASSVLSNAAPAANEAGIQSPSAMSEAKRPPSAEVRAAAQIQPASVRVDRSDSKARSTSAVAAQRQESGGANKTSGGGVEQCRDKFFFWREMCLAEQCEKPSSRHHPLCVKRRDDARVREESRVSPS